MDKESYMIVDLMDRQLLRRHHALTGQATEVAAAGVPQACLEVMDDKTVPVAERHTFAGARLS